MVAPIEMIGVKFNALNLMKNALIIDKRGVL